MNRIQELEIEIKSLKKLSLKYIGVGNNSIGYTHTDPYYFELLKEIGVKQDILESLKLKAQKVRGKKK
jgi:hypothetical protein